MGKGIGKGTCKGIGKGICKGIGKGIGKGMGQWDVDPLVKDLRQGQGRVNNMGRWGQGMEAGHEGRGWR